MLFEMSNDIVPVLLSISVYLTFVTIHLALIMMKGQIVRGRILSNEKPCYIESAKVVQEETDLLVGETQRFITRMTKRKEAPEDDSDYVYSLRNKLTMNDRGGERW